MGIIQALGYEVPRPNAAQRAMWHVSASRLGSWIFARTLPKADRFLLWASRGRITVPGVAAGIPVLTITTVGARTGLPRTTPLIGIPYGEDIAVIGTRFGQHGTPGWFYNLRSDPRLQVAFRDNSVQAIAREADAEEWNPIWTTARGIYAGYEAYARRIQDRQIRIMVLSS
ncbi:MAG TPA: nitroreductase family deazaflavin-dependent oxidoreductase [Streptosporangiaceae bacterium]